MTLTLPAAINLHTLSHTSDPRARGLTGTGFVGTRNSGNLPITTVATRRTNTIASSQTGALNTLYWEYLATGGYDVSSDTRVVVFTWQFNAPNRIQVSDVVNDGIHFRIGSGAGSPPSNHKHYQIGGNDTVAGSSRETPRIVVIDLNDTSHETEVGTFDNTDVQTYAFGTVRFNIVGTSTHESFYQRVWVFTTTRASADIPTFTAASDWDDLVDLVNGTDYTDKIGHEWALREGSVYSFACPIQFGDNSVETDFNDNGVIVFWPDTDVAIDPRVRVTSQAFRVYANLRDNAADTLTLSGRYDCGNSNPDWDFDLDLACTITIDNAVFKNIGTFLIGSSVTGAATFDGCGVVTVNNNGADLDGSQFLNANAAHLLRIPL